MTFAPFSGGSNPDLALPDAASLLAAIQRLFPQARVTSGYRGPDNPLTLRNPRSMHAQGSPDDPRAVDVAPIPGMAFTQYIDKLKQAGISIAQAFDEAKHPFPWTTGPNWHVASSSGGGKPAMPPRDPYYSRDPLAPLDEGTYAPLYPNGQANKPEPPRQPVPVDNSLSPSITLPSAAPAATKKRGGILGALESVFMPDADSRWAAALRGGIFDAKANQKLYKEQEYQTQLDTMMKQAKLKTFLTKGEYQVVGNAVFHTKPDGTTEWLQVPTDTDKERMFHQWQAMPIGPDREMLGRILLGGNADEVLAKKAAAAAAAANIRAGATTTSARIRANAPHTTNINIMPPLPPGAKVIH